MNNSQQEGVASPGVKRNAQAQQRSNGSQDRSQMNDDGMTTPRNLPDRGQPGSGTLAENKRSMDGAIHNQSVDGQELLEHVQSATQSQQFKTMDDSKTQLHEDT